MRVYLDNASTTPLTKGVKEVLIQHINEDFGNPSSIHFHGRKSRSLLEKSRKSIARSINASVGEIFFTSSATEANNMILKRAVADLGVTKIISSPTEHHCILHTLDDIRISFPHVQIIYLSVDNKGSIQLDELKKLLENNSEPTLVTLMYGNNEIGTLHDVPSISAICKENNAYFHSDVVQAIGKMPLDVSKDYFSFLSVSAHKFHGPKGVGFFYMNSENLIKPFIHGGAQERNMRAGTENFYGIIAMAKALEESIAEQSERKSIRRKLKDHFIDRLQNEFDDVRLNGETSIENSLDHILSVSFPPTMKADMLMFNLDIEGISASSGSACSSGIESDSHVMVAIGHPSERKTIRFSFSHLNTIEEIDYTIAALKKHI